MSSAERSVRIKLRRISAPSCCLPLNEQAHERFADRIAASLYPDMVDIPDPIWVVSLAIGFSATVGVMFGLIPAFKAAIIHPIDAL